MADGRPMKLMVSVTVMGEKRQRGIGREEVLLLLTYDFYVGCTERYCLLEIYFRPWDFSVVVVNKHREVPNFQRKCT